MINNPIKITNFSPQITKAEEETDLRLNEYDLIGIIKKLHNIATILFSDGKSFNKRNFNKVCKNNGLVFGALKNECYEAIELFTGHKKTPPILQKFKNNYRTSLGHKKSGISGSDQDFIGMDELNYDNFWTKYLEGFLECKYLKIKDNQVVINIFDESDRHKNIGIVTNPLVEMLFLIITYVDDETKSKVYEQTKNETLFNEYKSQKTTSHGLLNEFLSDSSAEERNIKIRILGYSYALNPLNKEELLNEIVYKGYQIKKIQPISQLLEIENIIKDTGHYYLPQNTELCREAADEIQDEIIEILNR
ncbi:MAG: hypothetical protein ACJA0S_001206 [Rickettsiales bacterium]|jgi:hypothetical protein